MHNISMAQALSVWSDLDDAYWGRNGFGGDTAEIYIYRLRRNDPCELAARDAGPWWKLDPESPTRQNIEASIRAANCSLHALLGHFAKERDCSIEVNSQELGVWVAMGMEDHRVQVRVSRREKAEEPR